MERNGKEGGWVGGMEVEEKGVGVGECGLERGRKRMGIGGEGGEKGSRGEGGDTYITCTYCHNPASLLHSNKKRDFWVEIPISQRCEKHCGEMGRDYAHSLSRHYV